MASPHNSTHELITCKCRGWKIILNIHPSMSTLKNSVSRDEIFPLPVERCLFFLKGSLVTPAIPHVVWWSSTWTVTHSSMWWMLRTKYQALWVTYLIRRVSWEKVLGHDSGSLCNNSSSRWLQQSFSLLLIYNQPFLKPHKSRQGFSLHAQLLGSVS